MQTASDIGNGVAVEAQPDEPSMAAHSIPSPAAKTEKKKPSNGLSASDRLAIAQQAIADLRQSVPVSLINHPTEAKLILVLDGVRYCGNCHAFRFLEQMIGDVCQSCART